MFLLPQHSTAKPPAPPMRLDVIAFCMRMILFPYEIRDGWGKVSQIGISVVHTPILDRKRSRAGPARSEAWGCRHLSRTSCPAPPAPASVAHPVHPLPPFLSQVPVIVVGLTLAATVLSLQPQSTTMHFAAPPALQATRCAEPEPAPRPALK